MEKEEEKAAGNQGPNELQLGFQAVALGLDPQGAFEEF